MGRRFANEFLKGHWILITLPDPLRIRLSLLTDGFIQIPLLRILPESPELGHVDLGSGDSFFRLVSDLASQVLRFVELLLPGHGRVS